MGGMRLAAVAVVLALLGCSKSDPPVANVPAPAFDAGVHAPLAPEAAASDPIARLVATLEARPMWTNGGFPKITLPADAPTEKVLEAVFSNVSFDEGRATVRSIVERREVQIRPEHDSYMAVLVDTSLGRKIALLRYRGPTVGWWSRVFDEDEKD